MDEVHSDASPMKPTSFEVLLAGGDRRSVGRAELVAAVLRRRPGRLGELIDALDHPDAVVRMRSADAVEKATRDAATLLVPHKRRLLRLLERAPQQEVRWHLAQIVPRLELTKQERVRAVAQLTRYLGDTSNIVRVCALPALADLSQQDGTLRAHVEATARALLRCAAPSLVARSRKVLKQLSSAPGVGRSRTEAKSRARSRVPRPVVTPRAGTARSRLR